MKKSEISSKSSARTREELVRRGLVSDFRLTGGEEAAKHLRGIPCKHCSRPKSSHRDGVCFPDTFPTTSPRYEPS